MLVLVFDTETNGLPPRINYKEKHPTIDEMTTLWPYIVQISGILFNTDTKTIVDSFDSIIKLDEAVEIPDECIAIHGISKEISDEKGIDIRPALIKFVICLEKAHIIVGHNLQFDKTLIEIELHRNGYHNAFRRTPKIEYCTMKYGEKLTKLTMISKITGKPIKKSPKLFELYEHLFGKEDEQKQLKLHNSLVDVLICARCYVKITTNDDLFKWKDATIETLKSTMYV